MHGTTANGGFPIGAIGLRFHAQIKDGSLRHNGGLGTSFEPRIEGARFSPVTKMV